MQFEFSKQSSNIGKKIAIFKTLATTFFEIKKKKKIIITEERITSSPMFWMAS